jgi:hypothetical protein
MDCNVGDLSRVSPDARNILSDINVRDPADHLVLAQGCNLTAGFDSPQDAIFIARYCVRDVRKSHDCSELVDNIVHVDILIH